MRTEIFVRDEKVNVWIQGTYLDEDKNAIAIVGSRHHTRRGETLARQFSYELSKKGFTIVSGLALGIDTIAHWEALAAAGRTIAVLAHGTDRIYPSTNSRLANEIIKHGCLITKYPPGTIPFPKNFLARNQLIAGLSKGVLIIEGQERSGTISTANHAANLGVEVFAIPGSPATDMLINYGAISVTNPQDILKHLT